MQLKSATTGRLSASTQTRGIAAAMAGTSLAACSKVIGKGKARGKSRMAGGGYRSGVVPANGRNRRISRSAGRAAMYGNEQTAANPGAMMALSAP